MWLTIHTHGVELTNEDREHLERRLQFALGRFDGHIGRVDAYLSDLNGPRGGIDKHLRFVAKVFGCPPAVVEDKSDNLDGLIDSTANRLGQTVNRMLAKQRHDTRHAKPMKKILPEGI